MGQGSLKVANYPFCKMIYPTGETDWQLPDRGHMDGYTRPGQVDTFTLGITHNLNDIQHRGDDECLARDYANYRGSKDKWEYTAPVGSFKPNGYGLYNIVDNVS